MYPLKVLSDIKKLCEKTPIKIGWKHLLETIIEERYYISITVWERREICLSLIILFTSMLFNKIKMGFMIFDIVTVENPKFS